MKKPISFALALALVFVVFSGSAFAAIGITSESVDTHGRLATVCASTGANPAGSNSSLQLSWTSIASATSYAVIVVDMTAPGNGFIHWAVANVPTNTLSLNADASLPAGVVRLPNDTATTGYFGPQPPSGTGTHIYQVHIVAQDQNVTLADFNAFVAGSSYASSSAAIAAFVDGVNLGGSGVIDSGNYWFSYTYGDNTPYSGVANPGLQLGVTAKGSGVFKENIGNKLNEAWLLKLWEEYWEWVKSNPNKTFNDYRAMKLLGLI